MHDHWLGLGLGCWRCDRKRGRCRSIHHRNCRWLWCGIDRRLVRQNGITGLVVDDLARIFARFVVLDVREGMLAEVGILLAIEPANLLLLNPLLPLLAREPADFVDRGGDAHDALVPFALALGTYAEK